MSWYRTFRPAPRWLALVLSTVLVCMPSDRAWAFIDFKFPLGDLIQKADLIFLAKVQQLDPAKPSVVLTVGESLKGTPSYTRLPINLTGDKQKHTPLLLKRLRKDLPVVVCISSTPQGTTMLAFTNGTWFQVLGRQDGNQTRWAFTHCEIYLRRTFKGSTAELESLVRDVLDGKRKPPDYDASETPGFGPEIDAAE